jgi:hypothetical protein
MNIHWPSAVAAAVVAPPIGPVGDVTLVDVGASGGIADYWASFGDALVAVGFDPLVTNMKKMNAAEARPRVRYEAAFVGCHGFDERLPPDARRFFDPYQRSSAVRAQELMRVDFVADHFNEGDELVWSDTRVTLDDRFSDPAPLDFLKVDTDGSDIQVLLGADRLLREGAFLGVMVEAQFHGVSHDYANTFANIDRYLRSLGFMLFDLDRNRYTRAVLPGRFEYDITAQTLTGQVLWGDALYLRDLADPGYAARWSYSMTRERLLKLAALFDLHGLPDCAAELLLAHANLTSEPERESLLDMLAASAGLDTTFREHSRRFATEPKSFFPAAYRPASVAPPPAPPQRGLAWRAARKAKRLLGV